MSEESESHRLKMLRRLQQKDNNPPPPKVMQAEKVIAKYREQKERDHQTLMRLNSPLPEPNLCPDCFYIHDRCSLLMQILGDDPVHFDTWKCETCTYKERRKRSP
jgi:hypothetical protein